MSIGEQIRQERLSKNLSLEQVSESLKIPPRCLEAIERDDSDSFSSRAYYLGHLKLYLKLLNLEHLMPPSETNNLSQNAALIPQISDNSSPTIIQVILSLICAAIIYSLAGKFL